MAEAKEVTKYIHEPDTAPFAVLYLATEGLYAEVASDEALVARVRSDHRVLLCGPSTIAALLNSLALGMRTVEINRKAEEIRQLLAAVRDQYTKFTTQLAKVRKKLGEAEGRIAVLSKEEAAVVDGTGDGDEAKEDIFAGEAMIPEDELPF